MEWGRTENQLETAKRMQDVVLGALPKVREIVDLSKSEIYRRIAANTFPAPAKLGYRCNRWNLAEVRAWAAARLAERKKVGTE